MAALLIGLAWGGGQGRTLAGCGIAMVALGSLEVALREHLAGYRSHSALLALVVAGATVWGLHIAVGVLSVPSGSETTTLVRIAFTVGAFVLALARWRALFARRSGGVGFRA